MYIIRTTTFFCVQVKNTAYSELARRRCVLNCYITRLVCYCFPIRTCVVVYSPCVMLYIYPALLTRFWPLRLISRHRFWHRTICLNYIANVCTCLYNDIWACNLSKTIYFACKLNGIYLVWDGCVDSSYAIFNCACALYIPSYLYGLNKILCDNLRGI